MFLLIGRYTAPIDEVERHLDGHREWVRAHAEAGRFIAAGREVPLGGGLIVATGVTRADLDLWIQDDPFIVHGVAQYDIREYETVFAAPGAEALTA